MAAVSRHGLDDQQLEAAIVVTSIFNYYTRVADASGIEFDYETPLPAFEPDLSQAAASRPTRPSSVGANALPARRQIRHRPLREAWASWRSYLLDGMTPISPRERRLLAAAAAAESADWAGADLLGEVSDATAGDEQLIAFAQKLSRRPWAMRADDLAMLRAAGYPEPALLHIISVTAHQNANSRLVTGLSLLG